VIIWLLPAVAAVAQTQPQVIAGPAEARRIETAQDTNNRITQLVLTTAPKGDYILGSGDLLGVDVFDVPELTREVRISESGLISLPLLPVKVRAAGLTAFQLQDKLAELLQVNGLVTNPQVTISVKEQHGEPIAVIGAVKTPMVIQAVRQMTVLEVLSRVGGIAEDAGGEIIVTRAAKAVAVPQQPIDEGQVGEQPDPQAQNVQAEAYQLQTGGAQTAVSQDTPPPSTETTEATPESETFRINLYDLLNSGDPQYNIVLRGGDVVSVPRAGVVYAVGAVQRPGGFVIQNDRQQLSVLKVLALSGGLTSTAKSRNAVIIRQGMGGGEQYQVPVDVEKILAQKAEDPLLQQSDILFVPNSASKLAMARVASTALSLATGVAIVRLGN
jgi:polysaccharide export outer membrane protein